MGKIFEIRKFLIGIVIIGTFSVGLINPFVAFGSDAIETTGDVVTIVIPVVAIGMILTHNDKEGFGQFVEAVGSTSLVTLGLKQLVDEERPNGGSQSFPSGHATLAFAGAGFIQQRYGWVGGIPAYLAASFVGWSRVEAEEHYAGDVIAGAAIGILGNLIFTKSYKEKDVYIDLVPIEKGAAATISLSW